MKLGTRIPIQPNEPIFAGLVTPFKALHSKDGIEGTQKRTQWGEAATLSGLEKKNDSQMNVL